MTRLSKSLDDGIGTGDDRMTVRAFLNRWLADVVNGPASSIRAGTRAGYALNVRLHLAPGIGHHTLAKLAPTHVQAFLNAKLRDGLSPRTVQYLHGNLRNALKHAERWGLVARNVAKLVDAPSVPKHEAQSLSTEQAGNFLRVLRDNRLRALSPSLSRWASAAAKSLGCDGRTSTSTPVSCACASRCNA